jgi:hypothetical protein
MCFITFEESMLRKKLKTEDVIAKVNPSVHVSSIHVDLPLILMNGSAYLINTFFIDFMS